METISLTIGDSSEIYEFSSKQIEILDDKWDGSWVVSEAIGSETIIEGDLIKNQDILNDDSLINEDYTISYKIFESSDDMIVEYSEMVLNNISTINGKIFKTETINDVHTEVPFANTYITFTIKGKFVKYTRSLMVKTDNNGLFVLDLNLDKTVKTKENSFFIFQLMPLQSEQLEEKTYYLSIEVRQLDINDILVFRKEVLHSKLKMTKQGVQ